MELDTNFNPVIKVDGFVEKGKQFDIEVVVPEDNRNVIYGVLKNRYGDPIKNAVIKLIEISKEHHGKEERKPVSHTFSDKDGEFVFGPLCPDKFYEIQIWANEVKHVKICEECKHEEKCLKGTKIDACDFKPIPDYPCEQ